MPESPVIKSPARARLIALAGNPNVGKTSLFNQVTGLRQKVANYPGVTVERREGAMPGRDIRILDLPGVNSLVARSPDEHVAAGVLLGTQVGVDRPDAVVVVLDAARPRRGLFLLSQVLELGIPTLVCLNMADEARRDRAGPDAAGLEEALGVPVVETVGTGRSGTQPLIAAIDDGRFRVAPRASLPLIRGVQGLPEPSVERWGVLRQALAEAQLEDTEVAERYRWAAGLLARTRPSGHDARQEQTDKIDRVLLHPLAGPLVFILVMGAVFQAVFSLADVPIGWIETGFGLLGEGVRDLTPAGLFQDFLVDGMVAGVGSVVVFLPQILILFFFIGLLEDSGYMTRAAFIVDRPLRAVGLSGRAFIPLLSSFACAVPGVMATRSIEDRRERMITMFVAPLLTCSARLPVYAILIGTFIPEQTVAGFLGLRGLVLLGLYFFGMATAVVGALIMDRILTRSGHVPSFLEMAPYRWPGIKTLGLRLWHRGQLFLRRAGTVILVMSVLIWALLAFPRATQGAGEADADFQARQGAQSIAGRIGHAIEPVIEPLGYDWRIGIGLVGSLAAREVFVSTMGVVYAVEEGDSDDGVGVAGAMERARWGDSERPVYTLPTVLSLLVFFALALQCVSTIAVVWRESGSGFLAAAQFFGFLLLAYAGAFITYQLAS
jgi:ferrous iron transport protein B